MDERAMKFIEQIARIRRAGECTMCDRPGTEPNPDCSEHQAVAMEPHSAEYYYARIDSLIAQARQIMGYPNAEFEI